MFSTILSAARKDVGYLQVTIGLGKRQHIPALSHSSPTNFNGVFSLPPSPLPPPVQVCTHRFTPTDTNLYKKKNSTSPVYSADERSSPLKVVWPRSRW